MGYFRPGFLLIELLALILLITMLISLFMGGQGHLLTMQAEGVKKLRELNKLVTENERAVCPAGNSSSSLQVEKFALTRPVITDSAGKAEKWTPQLACFIACSKESSDKKQRLWLPRIGVSQ